MTLGELNKLVTELRKRWTDTATVGVASTNAILHSRETIVGHFEGSGVDGRLLLIVGKDEATDGGN